MLGKQKKIEAVDVYLKKRKSREYVGQLTHKEAVFVFVYDDSYLYKNRSIPLGPDLALTQKKFTSKVLFPSFEDRIPSNRNPAYNEYCEMVGIDPSENDPLILLATLGQKGPSSFIFSPAPTQTVTSEDIVNFRKELNLTVREFSDIFDFSPATINRIEKKTIYGKDAMKRLEIYYNFPDVALNEVKKNQYKINEEKIDNVVKYLHSKLKNTRT